MVTGVTVTPSLTQFSAEAFLMQALEHVQEFQPFWEVEVPCPPASQLLQSSGQAEGVEGRGCCCSSFSPHEFSAARACGIGDDCVESV